VPVRPSIGEVDRVNHRRVGVGAEQQRPILRTQPGSEGDRLQRLDDAIGHAWRSVITHSDKRRSLRLCLDAQDPLRLLYLLKEPRTGVEQPAAADGDTVPPYPRVGRLPVTQIDAADYPIGASRISEDLRRAGMELLRQHQVRGEFSQQIPLPFRCLGAAERYVP
jgi:hypothetical protein